MGGRERRVDIIAEGKGKGEKGGEKNRTVAYPWMLSARWNRSEEKFLTGEDGGKKRGGRHATGGAYLNSRLTFIYLATFNFYGRDLADRLASQVAPAVWSERRRDARSRTGRTFVDEQHLLIEGCRVSR